MLPQRWSSALLLRIWLRLFVMGLLCALLGVHEMRRLAFLPWQRKSVNGPIEGGKPEISKPPALTEHLRRSVSSRRSHSAV